MSDIDTVLDDIRPAVRQHFEDRSTAFDPDNPDVPLARAPYATEEVMEAVESLLSTYVSLGDNVEQFEAAWSNYLGAEYGIMVNSGSSANLLALTALADTFPEQAEVIVPAVTWSTTISPIIDAGARPVFVDVDPDTFMMDPDAIHAAVTDNTAAIMPVHLLGNPAPMDVITDLCADHNLALIEDCCEAHGAEFNGKKVGTFGEFGTFSFSFSHHITTTEGGMVVTDSNEYRQKLQLLRSWGQKQTRTKNDLRDTRFVSHGYNLRPTEIQGGFGIHQTKRMADIVQQRRDHATYLHKQLTDIEDLSVLEERGPARCSYLHYPLLLDAESSYHRNELRSYLEEHGIETRPILAGDITQQPAFQNFRTAGDLDGARHLDAHGLYVSNHHTLSTAHLDHIADTVQSFFI